MENLKLKLLANTEFLSVRCLGGLSCFRRLKLDDQTVMTAKQIKELQKRNALLEEENLILKKAIAIFTPHSSNA